MNILVTGAGGQLGREMAVCAAAAASGTESGDRWFFTDVCEGFEPLDITSREAVGRYVLEHRIDAVVNCAAFTNVDAAESAFDAAERLNAEAPGNLAEAMREAGGLLIHISTDYVFGGEMCNVPLREDATVSPTGVYGLTKLHGEQRVAASGCKAVILRTAWLYSEFGKNFCKTMLSLTASKPSLKVVFDQVGTPTYALDLARAVMAVLADYRRECCIASGCGASSDIYSKGGIYHFSNEGVCSWYDFAKKIQELSGHASCVIEPCHSSEFPSPVKRPAYSVLDKTKIKTTFGISVPYWTDSLRLCLGNSTIL